MASSTIDDAAITRLLTNCRAALATGVITKLNGKDLELICSLCERATTSNLSGALADQAADDANDGRPIVS